MWNIFILMILFKVVQEVTRTSLNQTLSWLDLTNFQVITNFLKILSISSNFSR